MVNTEVINIFQMFISFQMDFQLISQFHNDVWSQSYNNDKI